MTDEVVSAARALRRRAVIDRPLEKLTADELSTLMALADHARLFSDRIGRDLLTLAELAVAEDSARELAAEVQP